MSFSNFFTQKETDKIKNNNFLIVGGAGYIGSHIAQLLVASGAKTVKVIDNLQSEDTMRRIHSLLPANNFDFIKCGTNKHNLIEEIVENDEINLILYLANDTHIGSSADDPTIIIDEYTNFVRILNIARAWANGFIYASSSAVYGENYDPDHQLKESDSYNPMTPYAAMKVACESIARSYTHLYGFPTLGLRYFEIYGTDQKYIERPGDLHYDLPLISQYITPILHAQDVHVDITKNDIINMCHIQDCAIITTKAMLSDFSEKQILNVGGKDNISKLELINLILIATESSSNIIHNNINFIDRIIDFTTDDDIIEPDDNLIDHNIPDLTNMLELTGYEPQVALMNGLIEASKHYAKTMLYKSNAINAMKNANVIDNASAIDD